MSTEYLPADIMDRADWFVHDRFGMFIHWGLYAIPSVGEWALKSHGIPYDEYRSFAPRFNPVQFDAKEWAAAAAGAGMRYMVFTTKHHDGFCMFDNPHTEWKISNTPFRRDVTRELADACRARGMRMGFYHSLIDWTHPDYRVCDNHPLWGKDEAKTRPQDQAKYIAYLHQSVRHLLSQYGKVDVLWLDFTPPMKSAADWDAAGLLKIVRELQPQALVDDRLDRHDGERDTNPFPGDFSSPEQVLPSGPVYLHGKRRVWEACVTMNNHWGYVSSDPNYKPTKALIHMLVHCVANDGNLLLNVGPDALGRIPEESLKRLAEIGRWLKDNGAAIYGAGPAGEGLKPPPGCLYTRNGSRLFLHVLDWPYMAVRLPGLNGRLKGAYLLRDGSRLGTVGWNSTATDLTLALPYDEPEPLDTVIELDISG